MADSIRLQKNQDILDEPVWIRHPETKRVEKVFHKAHVKRLLDEGGLRVPAPEERDASPSNDVATDKPRATAHR